MPAPHHTVFLQVVLDKGLFTAEVNKGLHVEFSMAATIVSSLAHLSGCISIWLSLQQTDRHTDHATAPVAVGYILC